MEAEKAKTTTANGKADPKTEAPTAPMVVTPLVTSTATAPIIDPVAEAEAQENFENRPSPEQYTITPKGVWPPPIYVDPHATEQERYYIEHRWHSQWDWYDKRASEAKKMYQRLQLLIGVGSVTVPVLIGFRASDPTFSELLTITTVFVSLTVAIAAAVENVKKFGDNWRSFRGAAEELLREKALYDVKSGPYRKTKAPFQLFVQRCEEIITKQNGSFLQLAEEVQQGQPGQQPSSVRTAEDTAGI